MKVRPGAELVTYPFKPLLISGRGYPNPFNANSRAGTKRPSVCVTESAKSNRRLARERKYPGHLIGCRKGHAKATYLL